jgi:DNA-binding MarR family transcriptional regulator
MEKKHLENFFEKIVTEPEYKQFGLTLPITLIYRNIFNEAENYFKTTHDLIHSDVDVLTALYFNGKVLSPTDLYAATVFSSGGMTKILKKLESRGYIRRKACPKDKRSTLVFIEEKGEKLVEKCLIDVIEQRKGLFEVLTSEEKENLQKILEKLTYTLF